MVVIGSHCAFVHFLNNHIRMTTAALQDIVRCTNLSVSSYDLFKARLLLAMGANPNHMVLDEELTIVELAAERCEESLIWVFVNDVGVDFDVRPGFDKSSPLAQLLMRHYGDDETQNIKLYNTLIKDYNPIVNNEINFSKQQTNNVNINAEELI